MGRSTKLLPLISENPFSSSLTNYSAEERLICESMVKYWINFVKSDNPGEEWPKFNNGDKSAKRAIMFLNGNNSKLLNYSINDQLYQFWTNSKSLKIESNFILIILLVIFQLF
jgi:carboxylesterase type B